MLLKNVLPILRKRKNLTQSELEKIAGPPRSVISHFERGRREPSIKNIKKLCGALECSSDLLLGITIDDQELEYSDMKFKFKYLQSLIKEMETFF